MEKFENTTAEGSRAKGKKQEHLKEINKIVGEVIKEVDSTVDQGMKEIIEIQEEIKKETE